MPQQINIFTLKTKEEIAIQFIQKYEPPEGYFVGFSGGKDSTVLLSLVQKSKVKYQAYYSATGIDPPELVKFIRQHYPEIIWKRPYWKGHRSFFGMIPHKTPPTKFVRWCCDELKKNPTKSIPLSHRLMGIRAEESAKRRNKGQINRLGKWTLYSPIFYWLEWEIWDYIEINNLPVCSLYDEGFHRLGCVVCPFICNPNQTTLNKYKKRWPKHYYAFEKAMKKLWDTRESQRQIKKYATTFQQFLNNWYLGN